MTRDFIVVSFIERYVDLIDESNYERLIREAYNQLTNDQVKDLRQELLEIDIDTNNIVEQILTKITYYASLRYYGDKFAINAMTLQTFVMRYMNNMLGLSFDELSEFIQTKTKSLGDVVELKRGHNNEWIISRK